jgi:hypothetical protein
MGWKLLNPPRTLRVTKKLATEFAEMEPAPHDRPLSERRLQVYAQLLAKGQFRPVTWARAVCPEVSETYRVNGKHTSVLLSGLKEMPEFYVTIEDYECESLDDVARLYATFDSRMVSRTTADINMSFAGTVPELNDIPRLVINLAVNGMTFSPEHRSYDPKLQPAERAETLLENPGYVCWLDSILAPSKGRVEEAERPEHNSKHLQRAPTAAAMYHSFQKSKAAATEFWTKVRDETDTEPGMPTRRLARFLLTTALGAKRSNKDVTYADQREFFVKCVHAWNAWRKGETTNLKYYPEAKVPSLK